MQNQPNLLILGHSKFPFGSPAASRIRTIAKGLVEKGAKVHIIIPNRIALREEDRTHSNQMCWQGITYESQHQYNLQRNENLSQLRRRWENIKATIKTWKKVLILIKSGEFNNILIYSRSAISLFPIVAIAHLYKASLFYDVVEWLPYQAFKLGWLNPLFYDDKLARYLPYLGCQGVIAISEYIAQKYLKYQIPYIILPSIIDTSIIESLTTLDKQLKDNSNSQFTVIYAGKCKYGDGFDRLLNAVKIAHLKGCPIQLLVLGTDGLSGNSLKQRKICDQDNILHSRVKFLGKVPDQNYFKTLNSANCLVLPRPKTQVVEAAFPTRLPEFLATGRPVVTTNVPDIPRYLEAGIHAEIVSEDTSQALANGLLQIWQNPQRAQELGIAGQQKCYEVFDYRQHIERLYQFLINSFDSIQ